MGIEVFVLIDVIGEEEPIGVEIVEAHVGSETDEATDKDGRLVLRDSAIELVTVFTGNDALVGIVEHMRAEHLRLDTLIELDAALFAFVVHNDEILVIEIIMIL